MAQVLKAFRYALDPTSAVRPTRAGNDRPARLREGFG